MAKNETKTQHRPCAPHRHRLIGVTEKLAVNNSNNAGQAKSVWGQRKIEGISRNTIKDAPKRNPVLVSKLLEAVVKIFVQQPHRFISAYVSTNFIRNGKSWNFHLKVLAI